MKWWLIAAAVMLPGLGFVLLGDGFETTLAESVESLRGWRLTAVVTGLLASDLLLPIPSSVLLAYAGRELGIFTATTAGAVGLTISCEVGYWSARLAGLRFVDRKAAASDQQSLAARVERDAAFWLVLTRPLPILAEAATLVAGLSRVPHRVFLPTVLIANVWVATCFATLGVLGKNWNPIVLLSVSAVVPLGLTVLARSRLSTKTDDESLD